MIKKLAIFILLFVFSVPTFASAFTVIENTNSSAFSTPTYNAERNRYISTFDKATVKRVLLTSYHDAAFTEVGTVKDIVVPDTAVDFAFGCNTYYHMQSFDSSNAQIGSLKFHATQIVNPDPGACFSELNDPGEGGTGTCDACKLLSCPGWTDYMSKLDDIKAAIPPAPDWPIVADVFRDSIAPQIKSDMAELIGTSPTPDLPILPQAPELPSAPTMLEGVDDGGIKAPTGNEAPGLGDSTFTEDDIKNSAPIIQERADPTGGFNIVDPIGSLPTQEEFISNSPIEGVAPLPGNPIELENISPTPTEQPNAAPTPTEPINTAPTPGDTGDTAPIPGDTGDAAPLPGTNTSTAPIPGVGNDTAPIPGGGEIYTAPTP